MKKMISLLTALVLLLCAFAALAESDYTYYPELEDFVGTWYVDDYILEIVHSDDDYNALNCVVTRYDADGTTGTRWIYDAASYDDVGNALATVEIGHRLECVFDGGELVSSETIYTDGAAAFALNGDGTLTWEDFKETPGENEFVFEKTVPVADYSGVTTMDNDGVEAFAQAAKMAYLEADWETLSTMIAYPITLYPDHQIEAPEAFVEYMNGKAPTAEDAAEMEREDCKALFANGQGICLGSGQIWFLDVNFDGVEQVDEPLLKIIAVSGVE